MSVYFHLIFSLRRIYYWRYLFYTNGVSEKTTFAFHQLKVFIFHFLESDFIRKIPWRIDCINYVISNIHSYSH